MGRETVGFVVDTGCAVYESRVSGYFATLPPSPQPSPHHGAVVRALSTSISLEDRFFTKFNILNFLFIFGGIKIKICTNRSPV